MVATLQGSAESRDAQAPIRGERRGSGARIQGASPTASPLYASAGQGKDQAGGGDRGRARDVGFYLGHRRERGACSKAEGKRRRIEVRRTEVREATKMAALRVKVARHTERRILVGSMRQVDSDRTRVLSPRQLPTDHDYAGGLKGRSANIRVINRRNSRLDLCSKCRIERGGEKKGRFRDACGPILGLPLNPEANRSCPHATRGTDR